MGGMIIPKQTTMNYDGFSSAKSSLFDRFSRKILFACFSKIKKGHVVFREKNDEFVFGSCTTECDMKAVVTIRHPSFYGDVTFSGTLGAGEAYTDKTWDCDDLTMLVRIILANKEVLQGLDSGLARLTMPLYKLFHGLRRNTMKGSKKNIVAHYDLGNDFYRLFLDETLTYSCAIFEKEDMSLNEASIAKYNRICKKLDLQPHDHVLEIGTGWGGFALHAVKKYGCKVTTTTISDKQYKLAQERFQKEGVADRVELLSKDYRDLRGTFDKIVSIEMIEAVGHHYYNKFFECCSKLLKDDGMMLLQGITIQDQVFEAHKKEVDFIKRYIFPGSCIPSITALLSAVTKSTNMKLFHLEDITPHYARTLRTWRQNFFEKEEEIKKMGYPESFIRMWEFYLCYCEAGFEERYLGNVHMLFTKPLCRKQPILPPLGQA